MSNGAARCCIRPILMDADPLMLVAPIDAAVIVSAPHRVLLVTAATPIHAA
jgi:hypothetical protein